MRLHQDEEAGADLGPFLHCEVYCCRTGQSLHDAYLGAVDRPNLARSGLAPHDDAHGFSRRYDLPYEDSSGWGDHLTPVALAQAKHSGGVVSILRREHHFRPHGGLIRYEEPGAKTCVSRRSHGLLSSSRPSAHR